jgi:glycosyltransferase involved in cell wall biosynthesis
MPTDDPAFKFGLWIQLPPFIPLKGEGIMTVLAEVIKAAARRPNTQVVVAMAKWTEEVFKSLLRDHGIPLDRVDFVLSRRRLPLLVRLRRFVLTRPRAPRRPPGLLSRITRALQRLPAVCFLRQRLGVAARASFRKVLATDSILVAGCCSLPLLLLLLAFGPPFLLLWGVRRLCLQNVLAQKLGAGLQSFHRNWLKHKLRAMGSRWLRWLSWAHNAVVVEEFRLLARAAFARADVPVWYVPHATAVHAHDIGRRIVVAIPDVVYAEFPTLFTDRFKPIDSQIRELVGGADAVVTYCEYVRQAHVVGHLGREAEVTHVIRHAAMDLRPHLRIAVKQHGGSSRRAAVGLIRDFVLTESRPSPWAPSLRPDYLRDFPFDEVDFLFVSSQIRPYKNYMNLFRAFEILLRRKHLNLKLFFTGRMELDTADTIALREFVAGAHLELDILSVPDLPPEVHAAFYHLARLTVVPTLFEGGFPFPFTESLSVDTPVVMSSTPVTRETLPPDLARTTLFDPYDVDDMAQRIHWGLEHRGELLAKQQPFYAKLRRRTWDRVLDEYLTVFRQALEAPSRVGPCIPRAGRQRWSAAA